LIHLEISEITDLQKKMFVFIVKLLQNVSIKEIELFLQNIKPQLLKMIQTVVDDEENLIYFSQIFGEIIYSFNEKFAEEINDIANEACNFF
jgi:hypothetical protein